MQILLDHGGLLRYSDDDRLAEADRGDWEPEDEEEFKERVHSTLDDEDGIGWMARCDGSGLVPGFDTRAAVALFRECPWSDDPESSSWVVLVIKDADSVTVVEYTSEEEAVSAFKAHVDHQDTTGDRYDYVYQPAQRRTAWPV